MAGDARIGRWAVGAMFLVNGFVMGAWAPQIPLLLPRHGIGEATLGLLILGLGLGAVGAMLFAGRLIARFGARAVLRGFAVCAVPTLPLMVFAPSLPLLAIAMAVFGGIIGCMDVAMNANAVAVERRLGGAIMSSSHGFWSLGGFVGGTLGGHVIARFGEGAQALIVAGLMAAVIGAAMPRLAADEPAAPRVTGVPRDVLLPRDAGLWLLGAMALFSMVPEGAVLDWAALYLLQELGASAETSGYAFGFFAGTMAVLRFMGDAVRNRFGAVRTLQVSGLIAAAGMIAAAAAPSGWLAIAGFAVSGVGVANMVPILFSTAGNHPGLSAGTGIATVTMVGYSGILIAPSTIGLVADLAGFRWTYGALALLLLVVVALAGRVAAADRRAMLPARASLSQSEPV